MEVRPGFGGRGAGVRDTVAVLLAVGVVILLREQ